MGWLGGGVGLHGGWWEGEEPNLNFVSGQQERRRDDGGELEVEARYEDETRRCFNLANRCQMSN